MKLAALLLFLFSLNSIYGQDKKKIDHTVYDSWNSISNINQSKTGALITYEINPQIGDGKL